MQILLTGGCGDLGQVVSSNFEQRGDSVKLLDLKSPASNQRGQYIHGSILDREQLPEWFAGCDAVVHIAAWHGIHEFTKEKDAYDFFDLNIRGTFEVFEAAVTVGVSRIVLLSSTSIDEPNTVYGNSKIISEQLASFYARHHKMNVITLRPRAFIPYWNRTVYANYVEWLKWFWKGAVHINDVAQAVEKSIDYLRSNVVNENLILTIDGGYEYSDEDLRNWDKDGSETSFKKHYEEFYELAKSHGLTLHQPPRKLDISRTIETIGYVPSFSLQKALEELKQFGEIGPPVQ